MPNDDNGGIVLASASRSRAALLAGAGLNVTIDPADIDESTLKEECLTSQATVDYTAGLLARKKAEKISLQRPDAIVIGADQMLDCNGKWLDKPIDLEAAAQSLRLLRGTNHELVTCVSVMRGGHELWAHTERARLKMRSFSDEFLEDYLSRVGEDALLSVGAYQLEGLGAQLFENIDGDYFTILGLPLLPLLTFLRNHGVVPK